jgi:hypothetical protein
MLVFGFVDQIDSIGLSIVWQSVDESVELISPDKIPVSQDLPHFHATAWRTVNYPRWEPEKEDGWSEIELPDGTSLLQPTLVLELLGIQIGNSPFVPPGVSFEGTIICSASTFRPTPSKTFPFLNQEQSLTNAEADETEFVLSRNAHGEMFGILYFVQHSDGSISWELIDL